MFAVPRLVQMELVEEFSFEDKRENRHSPAQERIAFGIEYGRIGKFLVFVHRMVMEGLSDYLEILSTIDAI